MDTDPFYSDAGLPDSHNTDSSKKRVPSLAQAAVLYSLNVLLLLLVGSRVQRSEFYTGVLITEFILVAGSSLAFMAIWRYNLKSTLRLNSVSFLNIFLVFWLMMFSIPLVAVCNYANLWLVNTLFGKVIISQAPVATNSVSLLLNIIVIGASAGICEELLFRGIIQRSFERFGIVKAILMASFLFGLMHLDFQKLLGTFLLGALIGFVVYRTNSLFTGMFAHFANNTFAVVAAYISTKALEIAKASGAAEAPFSSDMDFSAITNLPRAQLIAGLIVLAFIIIICACAFFGLLTAFIRNTASVTPDAEYSNPKPSRLIGIMWLLPGILTVSFIYVVQGLKLRGINIQSLDTILKLLIK